MYWVLRGCLIKFVCTIVVLWFGLQASYIAKVVKSAVHPDVILSLVWLESPSVNTPPPITVASELLDVQAQHNL